MISCGSKRDFGGVFFGQVINNLFNVNLNFGVVLLLWLSEANILRMYKYETIHCLKQAAKVGLLLVVRDLH